MKITFSDDPGMGLRNQPLKGGRMSLSEYLKNSRLLSVSGFLIFCIAVILPRWYYVSHFAVALPFWDQWDAEGDNLLRPFLEGRLRFSDLWQPHNEHRVFLPRLLTLIIFLCTGTWNNLNEVTVNIFIASAIPVFLLWLVYQPGDLRKFRWLMVPVILASAVSPFIWENLLVGFQSQFYFLVLLALTAIGSASIKPEHTGYLILTFTSCVLSVLTMASGILTPVAVAVIYIIHFLNGKKLSAGILLFILALLLLALLGFIKIPWLPGHEIYKSQNFKEFFTAVLYALSWPFKARILVVPLLWLPSLISILVLTKRKSFTQTDIVMTGIVIWSFLQAIAMAYGRGHHLPDITSRYADLLSTGIVGAAWFAIRIPELFNRIPWLRNVMALLSLCFFVTLYNGHKIRRYDDFQDMKNRYQTSVTEIRNVEEYLKTGDKNALQKPEFEIPYPDPKRLEYLLNNPTIRSILPDLKINKK